MSRFEDCIKHPAVTLCIRIFRWFPVAFIIAVVCWSYYAYVVELCINTVQNTWAQVCYLIPYHIFLFLFLWAYWQTAMCRIGSPPKHFRIPATTYEQMQQSSSAGQRQILERLGKNLPVSMRTFDGAVRFCEKCRVIKPDRSHHCSICGVCVLKMDHHCPWVNACVHYRNYKFFILFLGYALLFCLYVFLTDTYYFIRFWTDGMKMDGGSKFHIMFLFFVAGMFGISVSSLFFYHLWLTAKNRSTLEAFRAPVFRSGPDKNGFNLGCRNNYREVFGNNVLLGFLPIFSSRGDGASFPVSSRIESNFGGEAGTSSQVSNVIQKNDENQSSPGSRPPGANPTSRTTEQASPPCESHAKQNSPTSAGTNRPGDGISYPVKTYDTDKDGLLHHHTRNQPRKWEDEEESGTDGEFANVGRGDGNRRPKENPFPLTSIGIQA